MSEMQIMQCDFCGGSLDKGEKKSDTTYICPYCGVKNFRTPGFSFYKKAIDDSLMDINKSMQISLEMGKYEEEIDRALEENDVDRALDAKGKLIALTYDTVKSTMNLDVSEDDYFKIDMNKFKRERLDERGKDLNKKYWEAIKKQDLDNAASSLLELENYKLKGCNASNNVMVSTRRGIITAVRNFVKGFDASSEHKQEVLERLGLNKGLIRVEKGFICPACGGTIEKDEIKDEMVRCPLCENLFHESGIDKLTQMTSAFSSGGEKQKTDLRDLLTNENGEIDMEKVNELKEQLNQSGQQGEGLSFSVTMVSCPHCNGMMGYEEGKKVNCPHCGEEVNCESFE